MKIKSYSLRRRAVLRLLIVGVFFIMYAASMCYFNYYIHDVSAQIVKIYFNSYQRIMMQHSLSLIAKQAILTKNKELVGNNPDPNSYAIYLMDGVNILHESNYKEREFAKTASKAVFGNFLKLLERASSSEFCAVSDSYNSSQTIPCEKYYAGPKNQGIYAAYSYYTEFMTSYGNLIQNSDLNNPVVQNILLNDPTNTLMSIFRNSIQKYKSNINWRISFASG